MSSESKKRPDDLHPRTREDVDRFIDNFKERYRREPTAEEMSQLQYIRDRLPDIEELSSCP